MSTGTAELHQAIAAADQNFVRTFGRGDAAGMAALYTADGQLLPSNSDFVSGQQGIQAFWQGVMDMGIKEAQLETVELEGHGDTAIEVGRYELGDGAGNVLDRGKYLVIWKNESGTWKLHRDIWNTSVAAA